MSERDATAGAKDNAIRDHKSGSDEVGGVPIDGAIGKKE